MDHNTIIDAFGGTTKVAKIFGIKPPSVSGWRESGIPDARLMCLRLLRPDVFKEEQPEAPTEQAAA